MNESNAVVILDNGANTAKVGLSTQEEPQVIPNCIMKAKAERRRAFTGNQIEECRDCAGLFYILGFQKGYLLNWDVQKSVWDHIFSPEGSCISLEDRPIIITEPQLNFASISISMVEILFEEYHSRSIYKTTTADLAAYKHASQSGNSTTVRNANCLVVDCGYSFVHIIPFINGVQKQRGIRRIEVGGKALTNHLKEIISYRHLNVMDESYVVNQIKEDVCFVSQNFMEDMRVHSSPEKRAQIAVDYVLPDFTTVRRGFIRKPNQSGEENGRLNADDAQFIRLCNERFTVPEILFNPSDIGLNQMGVAEAVIDSLSDVPFYAHSELLRNIIVIGGSSLFPGFVPRLKAEIRSLAPDDMEVSIVFPEDPITYGWFGGKELACSDNLKNLLLTREEYEENGYSAANDI